MYTEYDKSNMTNILISYCLSRYIYSGKYLNLHNQIYCLYQTSILREKVS